jgi:hypothetical protein
MAFVRMDLCLCRKLLAAGLCLRLALWWRWEAANFAAFLCLLFYKTGLCEAVVMLLIVFHGYEGFHNPVSNSFKSWKVFAGCCDAGASSGTTTLSVQFLQALYAIRLLQVLHRS